MSIINCRQNLHARFHPADSCFQLQDELILIMRNLPVKPHNRGLQILCLICHHRKMICSNPADQCLRPLIPQQPGKIQNQSIAGISPARCVEELEMLDIEIYDMILLQRLFLQKSFPHSSERISGQKLRQTVMFLFGPALGLRNTLQGIAIISPFLA